jgi:hypothetical protein
MSLATPASVQKLQTALHAKAKGASSFRFYALYDKVYRKDVLAFAYQCCQANGGAAGVDGQSFEDIAAYGLVMSLATPASVCCWAAVGLLQAEQHFRPFAIHAGAVCK